MTDHKFTDEEVIKALECCSDTKDLMMCQSCPYESKGCNIHLLRDALALINRQKAEIEEQHQAIINALKRMGEIRSEAYKEFAERLKFMLTPRPDCYFKEPVSSTEIDNLVKKMTEDQE